MPEDPEHATFIVELIHRNLASGPQVSAFSELTENPQSDPAASSDGLCNSKRASKRLSSALDQIRRGNQRFVQKRPPSTTIRIGRPPTLPIRDAGTPAARAAQAARLLLVGTTDTTTRDADSPKSVTMSRNSRLRASTAGTSTLTPNPVSKQHSASVTPSRPPRSRAPTG